MIYLLLGEDISTKDKHIAQIRAKWSDSSDALQFDYEVLHATKLDPAVLKKTLLALPVIAPERLVVIRSIQDLSAQNQGIILDFIKAKNTKTTLILDSDETSLKDALISKIRPLAKVMSAQQAVLKNVFDMTKAMSARNMTEALKILSQLLEDGIHPLQIMGGLVWFWGKSKVRLSKENFKKGLLVLQEGDLNIKRSRLRQDYALEVVVTKLCYLIA